MGEILIACLLGNIAALYSLYLYRDGWDKLEKLERATRFVSVKYKYIDNVSEKYVYIALG